MEKILGLHHTSSIVKNPQENLDFYASFFGLRLVKKTSNHENKDQYHLYYANHDATSAITTHFPMQDAQDGIVGDGQTETVRYAIPKGSMSFWEDRLNHFGIFNFKYKRFNQEYLAFNDPHGLALEFVEVDTQDQNLWEFNGVTQDVAIQDIYNVSLASLRPEDTVKLFTEVFGYEIVDNDPEYLHLQVHDGIGGSVDIRKQRSVEGTEGTGTVHHIALSIPNGSAQAWKEKLMKAGYFPTAVKNRFYFESVYFRDKGGITIELATQGPGLTYDESVEDLGTQLIIPPHFKEDAQYIKDNLAPLELKAIDHLQTYSYRNRDEFEHLQARQKMMAELKALKASGADKEAIDAFKKDYLRRNK